MMDSQGWYFPTSGTGTVSGEHLPSNSKTMNMTQQIVVEAWLSGQSPKASFPSSEKPSDPP